MGGKKKSTQYALKLKEDILVKKKSVIKLTNIYIFKRERERETTTDLWMENIKLN